MSENHYLKLQTKGIIPKNHRLTPTDVVVTATNTYKVKFHGLLDTPMTFKLQDGIIIAISKFAIAPGVGKI